MAAADLNRRILLLLVLGTIAAAIVLSTTSSELGKRRPIELKTGEFYEMISRNRVRTAKWGENKIQGTLGVNDSEAEYVVTVPPANSAAGGDLARKLQESHVDWYIESPSLSSAVISFFSVILFPLFVIALVYFLVIRPNFRRE